MSGLPKVDYTNVIRGIYDPSTRAIKIIDTTQLIPTAYDAITLSYDGSSNITGVVYSLASVTVATLTLTYSGTTLISVQKS